MSTHGPTVPVLRHHSPPHGPGAVVLLLQHGTHSFVTFLSSNPHFQGLQQGQIHASALEERILGLLQHQEPRHWLCPQPFRVAARSTSFQGLTPSHRSCCPISKPQHSVKKLC